METQLIQLEITSQDIENARILGKNHSGSFGKPTSACPACLALGRLTHCHWKIVNASTVMQIEAPFRLGHVDDDLKEKLQRFRTIGEMEPGRFAVTLDQGLDLPSL